MPTHRLTPISRRLPALFALATVSVLCACAPLPPASTTTTNTPGGASASTVSPAHPIKPAAPGGMAMESHSTGTPVASAALHPMVIDLAAMTDEQIGPLRPGQGDSRSKMLLKTPNGALALQSGNVPKHVHHDSDEIQYIISGTGKFWLDDHWVDIHPGDLIVIPKNTPHSASVATQGRFKALSIKLPPQAADDWHAVP